MIWTISYGDGLCDKDHIIRYMYFEIDVTSFFFNFYKLVNLEVLLVVWKNCDILRNRSSYNITSWNIIS